MATVGSYGGGGVISEIPLCVYFFLPQCWWLCRYQHIFVHVFVIKTHTERARKNPQQTHFGLTPCSGGMVTLLSTESEWVNRKIKTT